MSRKLSKKEQKRHLQKIARNRGIGKEIIDWEARIDESLTYDENKSKLVPLIEKLDEGNGEKLADELTKDELEQYRSRANKKYLNDLEKKRSEEIRKLKEKEESNVDKFYESMREYVKMVINSQTENLIIVGNGGLGKSYQTMKVFSEENLEKGEDYEIISGFSSPLELYHILWKNRKKTIVFDDCQGVLDEKKAVSILKGAMWNPSGRKYVEYHTTSDKLECPERFEFEGNIILILNDVPKEENKSMEALVSRAIKKEVYFDYPTTTKLFYEIAKSTEYREIPEEERKKVVEHIEGITSEATDNLNIRSVIKSWDIYNARKENGWRQLVTDIFEEDEELKLVLDLMNREIAVSKQVDKYKKKFGKSRRSYFRRKKKLKRRIGS